MNENVTANCYKNIVKCLVIPALKQKRKFIKTIFQQDGATPHTAIIIWKVLFNKYWENHIISQGFPFTWPGYSADLNPVDYELWLYIKHKVNAKIFDTISERKDAIKEH